MKKLTVEFNDELDKILEDLKAKTGKSRAEILRQGIILRDYYERQKREGKKITITNKDDKIEKEIVLT